MKNGIKENYKINIINLKEVNEDNLLDEEDINEENEYSNGNINKKNKQKIKLKYTELLENIKNKDSDEFLYINEYLCNILLMPSEIDISNKIATLNLISYCYQKSEKAHLIYNIARKLENFLIYLKAVDPVFFVHVFLRAGYFLNIEGIYIYSIKYLNKAIDIIQNYRGIEKEKIFMCNQLKQQLKDKLIDYTNKILKQFNEEDIFSLDKCNNIKNIIDLILEGKNNLNSNNEYLYIINKIWLIKLKIFLVKYLISIETNNRKEFIKNALDTKNFINSYLKNETNIINNNNETNKNDEKKYNKKEYKKVKKRVEFNKTNETKDNNKDICFPGPINNFCITAFKDFWYDNINKDENDFLIDDLKINF